MIIQDLKTPGVIAEIQKKQTGLPHWLPSKLWIYWRLEVWGLVTSYKRMSALTATGLQAANGEVYERLEKEVAAGLKEEREWLAINFDARLRQQQLFNVQEVDQIVAAFKEDLEMIMQGVPA